MNDDRIEPTLGSIDTDEEKSPSQNKSIDKKEHELNLDDDFFKVSPDKAVVDQNPAEQNDNESSVKIISDSSPHNEDPKQSDSIKTLSVDEDVSKADVLNVDSLNQDPKKSDSTDTASIDEDPKKSNVFDVELIDEAPQKSDMFDVGLINEDPPKSDMFDVGLIDEAPQKYDHTDTPSIDEELKKADMFDVGLIDEDPQRSGNTGTPSIDEELKKADMFNMGLIDEDPQRSGNTDTPSIDEELKKTDMFDVRLINENLKKSDSTGTPSTDETLKKSDIFDVDSIDKKHKKLDTVESTSLHNNSVSKNSHSVPFSLLSGRIDRFHASILTVGASLGCLLMLVYFDAILYFILSNTSGKTVSDGYQTDPMIYIGISSGILLVSYLIITMGRLRDIGRSPSFGIILYLFPLTFAIIFMTILPGTPESNKYGPPSSAYGIRTWLLAGLVLGLLPILVYLNIASIGEYLSEIVKRFNPE